jgi:hypothetical protein
MSLSFDKKSPTRGEDLTSYSPPTPTPLAPLPDSVMDFGAMQSGVGNSALANHAPDDSFAIAPNVLQLQSLYSNAAVERVTEARQAATEKFEPAPIDTLPTNRTAENQPPGMEAKTAEKTEAYQASPDKALAEAVPPVKGAVYQTSQTGPGEAETPVMPATAPGEERAGPSRTSGVLEPEAMQKVGAAQPVAKALGPVETNKKEKKEGTPKRTGKAVESAPATVEYATAPAEGGEKEGGGREQASVAITLGNLGEMIDSLGSIAPSQAVLGVQALRDASAEEFTRQHQELADNPPSVPRPSGIRRKEEEKAEEKTGEGEEEKAPEKVEAEPGEQLNIQVETPLTVAPLPVPLSMTQKLENAPEEGEQLEFFAWASLNSVSTSDENVDTGAGPRPSVELNGEADPQQMSDQLATNRTTFDNQRVNANQEIAQDFGENQIFPSVPDEILTAKVSPGAGLRTNGKAQSAKGIPPEGLEAFDLTAADRWSAEISGARAKNAEAEEQKAADEVNARAKASDDIARLKSEAVTEQTAAQVQAKTDVNTARKGWSDELTSADATYTKTTSALETGTRKEIEKEKTTADEGARKELENAEREANEKKAKAESDAAKKRAEAKKESGGFLGWLKSKAKALLNAIRDAVNFIFDQLRKAVKWIIDKAKKAAMWLIEKARQAIVGLIHAFGKALELAADVFLAAFPKARDKFKALIRNGVAKAEDAVNSAADALKAGVSAVLDALGAALDFVLELYQKAYLAIIDAVEFVVIGLIEILEGIGRLAESASMVGDHFLGQVEEEGLGVDLTKPLPIEKPEKATDVKTVAQTAVTTGALTPADASLFTKNRLEDSDVAVTSVAQLNLDPALLASIPPLHEGEEFHFGQNEHTENQRESILADALATQVAGNGPMGGETTSSLEAGNEAPAGGGADTANVAQMTPEQQLDYLEKQEVPHTCADKKQDEPAKDEAVPEHMRIYGPFTSPQRFSYMWGQIKKGIRQWWSCNWGKILVAFAIGALVALLLGILTGGAIFAAIPPLLEIIATILVGVAIVRATTYVSDYLKLAWNGDLAGGAKALARGFAILVIELVFVLLFNIGSVIKALKSGLKGTVKAATGAAKNVFKTTGKALRELGQASKAAVKAGIKNTKLIIQGFRSGFGEGIKTIGELTHQLLGKTRFRGFFFRLRGQMLELWGRFNADVKLGEQKITLKEAEKSLADIAKAGEKITQETRAEAESIAKAVGKAAEEGAGELPKRLKSRIRSFFEKFKRQHVKENPVLAEVWNRSMKKLADTPSFSKYFKNGELIDNVPPQIMTKMYTQARSHMNPALEEVVAELKAGFKGKLTTEITKLPGQVQVHHLLYKSIFPELAVTKDNLILALRKVGGSLDELHDLFHLISAGGVGNRWRTLQTEIAELLKDIYGLR